MPAAAPAELHTPERSGSSNAIRRQDWRRGKQDCLLHLKAPPPSLPCRRPRRQSYTLPSDPGVPNADRRQDWRRGPQDCVLHVKAPPPGLPCQRARRQSHTHPSDPGVPTPSAAKTGGVASKTACSTSGRRGTRECVLHLKARRQARHASGRAGRATHTRAIREFQRHPPPRLAAWQARLLAPP